MKICGARPFPGCSAAALGWVALFASMAFTQTQTAPQVYPQAPSAVQVPEPPPPMPPAPTPAQSVVTTQAPGAILTIEQAIELARRNNPTLQANATLVPQNKEQEVTASLRPNPLLSADAQYIPIFTPSLFSSNYMDQTAQFDLGVGYLFERGRKRQHRLQAARDQTAVTEGQVRDAERTIVAETAQQFIAVLLAKSNLEFTLRALDSYQHTIGISQEKFKAGGMSKSDLLKIQLLTLQFQTDVANAQINKAQALAALRQLIGFDSVPRDFDVVGTLKYDPMAKHVEELETKALEMRPDLKSAQRAINAAQSQIDLAKANAKQDVNLSFNYGHVNASNVGAFYFNIPLPIFNRNQGEVARTYYVLTQTQFVEKASEQQVLTDVRNAYEALRNSEEVVGLYDKAYLQEAKESLEITQFSYQHGAASLLDFLDAERSYRSTELSYRQSLASYMDALEQLRQAVGVRELQ